MDEKVRRPRITDPGEMQMLRQRFGLGPPTFDNDVDPEEIYDRMIRKNQTNQAR
jgi:hypothetical protein